MANRTGIPADVNKTDSELKCPLYYNVRLSLRKMEIDSRLKIIIETSQNISFESIRLNYFPEERLSLPISYLFLSISLRLNIVLQNVFIEQVNIIF